MDRNDIVKSEKEMLSEIIAAAKADRLMLVKCRNRETGEVVTAIQLHNDGGETWRYAALFMDRGPDTYSDEAFWTPAGFGG